MKSIVWKIILLLLFFFVIISCNSNSTEPTKNNVLHEIHDVNIQDFTINDLEYGVLPFTTTSLANPAQNPNPVDDEGIEVFVHNDRTYYHPLHIAQRMKWYLDSYYQTNDPMYLSWTLRYYYKLLEIGTETNNDIYFNYTFDFDLHGFAHQTMKAPWLSGMTQGLALEVFSRLYKFTNDSTYLEKAKKVFNSFDRMIGEDEPWISMVDDNNYYWIEEYPDKLLPNFTLNGFIFSVFGLYEYYQITKDPYVEYIIQASLSTIKHYAIYFRVKGGISYYCLKHKVQSDRYHKIHEKQFRGLFLITGDQYFSDFADSLYIDFH